MTHTETKLLDDVFNHMEHHNDNLKPHIATLRFEPNPLSLRRDSDTAQMILLSDFQNKNSQMKKCIFIVFGSQWIGFQGYIHIGI